MRKAAATGNLTRASLRDVLSLLISKLVFNVLPGRGARRGFSRTTGSGGTFKELIGKYCRDLRNYFPEAKVFPVPSDTMLKNEFVQPTSLQN